MRSSWKKELISGICGGVVFFVIYLVGDNFIISLIGGGAIFIFTRLLFPKETSSAWVELIPTPPAAESEDVISRAKAYLDQIDKYRLQVNHQEISSYLSGIVIIVKKMMLEADGSDNDRKIAKELVKFYMPSLCKIMDEYLLIAGNRHNSGKAAKFEEEVKHFLKELLEGFERQLDAMLADNIYDAKIEIEHVKNILKSDGFLGNDEFRMEEGE